MADSSITLKIKFDEKFVEAFKDLNKRFNKLEKELRLIKYSRIK